MAAPEAGSGAEAEAAPATQTKTDDIHVEAQVDQAVVRQALLADGVKSDRVARAKAPSPHYVRTEKARIRAEREAAS